MLRSAGGGIQGRFARAICPPSPFQPGPSGSSQGSPHAWGHLVHRHTQRNLYHELGQNRNRSCPRVSRPRRESDL